MKENSQIRRVDTGEYMQLVRSLINEGHEVPLVVTGSSMSPFLIHERDRILISPVNRPLKKGDMAFFQRRDGRYVMHRIHFIRKDKNTGEPLYFFIGDNQTETEGPIRRDQIFGLTTSVVRNGKTITEHDFWWLFFEHIWLHVIPLRRLIVGLYSHFFRKRT